MSFLIPIILNWCRYTSQISKITFQKNLKQENWAKMFLVADDETPCDSSPCQNGGACISDQCNFRCECPDAFPGTMCEGSK